MAFNIPGVPFKLNAADMGGLGGFDLGEAIRSGLNNYRNFHKARYEPRNLENAAVSAEQTNQINAPYAQNAGRVFSADIGTKEANYRHLLQKIAREKQQYEQEKFLNDLISGNNPGGSMQNSGGKSGNSGWTPGHMTPHGFEGSIAPTNPDNFYANTGEDRQAEQEAVDRIDRANAARQGESFVPSVPAFGQKIKQGMQGTLPGNTPSERANYIWENYPLYRKRLEALGFKPNKEHALTGAARDAESMERLRQMHGKDSPIVKEAEAINRNKQQQREDLSEIRHRQLNGLKPGDTEIKDPTTGRVIGFRKQTDTKQKESAKNTVLFNELYPLVYKGGAPFTGANAASNLYNTIQKAKSDPAAKKELLNFMLAEKALTNTTVTEAARFGSGRTNQTYNRYAESLKTENITPKLKKWLKEFGISTEMNLLAGQEWQKVLNRAEKKANKGIPATMDYYFDPEKQFAHEQELMNTKNDEEPNGDIQSLSDDELMKLAGYK